MSSVWIIKKRSDERFPYLLTIQDGEEVVLSLLVQDLWPGGGRNIFCLRADVEEDLEEVERVKVVSLRRYGHKISVVLDRPSRKRCYFLYLKKTYKTKAGEYEQIFWMTQTAMIRRRPKALLSTRDYGSYQVRIDKNERYPWRFPNCRVEKRPLPVGDYALIVDDKIMALIERKSFEDMLTSLSNLSVLHQRLGELKAYPYPALVIEANYQDFLNRKKLRYYSPNFSAKALGELSAFHPGLNIVFAGSRKLANEWALRFFAAVQSQEHDLPRVKDIITRYQGDRTTYGPDHEIIEKIKRLKNFTFEELKTSLPYYSTQQLRCVLRRLRKEGRIRLSRTRNRSIWHHESSNLNDL